MSSRSLDLLRMVVFKLEAKRDFVLALWNLRWQVLCKVQSRQYSGVLSHFINFENVYQILLKQTPSVLLMAGLPNFPIFLMQGKVGSYASVFKKYQEKAESFV
ncbi:hypothetical protein CMV_027319 [Castanea mollissima]|uniref:Uncharacterized protein n=1 Tax=Castanea mollissima TaxID=60419 RepID=A0A8J4Q6Q6_9ROSI|nr:hypothetical protein CMV_027319 [Castanea mollissima]